MSSNQPSSSAAVPALKPRCLLCPTFVGKNDIRISEWESKYQNMVDLILQGRQVTPPAPYTTNHRLCQKCFRTVMNKRSAVSQQQQPRATEALDWNEEVKVIQNVFSCGKSKCFICKAQGAMRDVPRWIRVIIYIRQNLSDIKNLPKGLVCCNSHLENIESLLEATKTIAGVQKYVLFTQLELYEWNQDVRQQANDEDSPNNIFSFSSTSNFSHEEYKTISGLTKDQFNKLFSIIEDKVIDGRKCTRKMLGMFLMKMRQNISDSCLKVIFNFKSRQYVSDCINVTRKILMTFFVPLFLGVNHISREDFIKLHNTTLANLLYFEPGQEKVIIVIDGTYIYIEKSSNYTILKRSFSMHKKRHLVKPTMIVGCDGYVLAVLGPHMTDGANNDARILVDELQKEISDLRTWLEEDDVMIVDRGYRDSLDFLADMGIITHMPHFMKAGQKQHTTEEANESRLVTKLRWIVEKMNGDVKQIWKFLNGTISTAHLGNIGDFFRIGCALLNAFYPRVQIKDNPYWMSEQLIARGRGPNLVQQRVEAEELLKRKKKEENKFAKLSAGQLQKFPFLSEDDLREITLGSYQLKQASHYVAEKQFRDGQFNFEVYNVESTQNTNKERLIRAKVWSRHSKQKSYKVFIHYEEDKDGSDGIYGWYCTCPAGARTVGCCAHVSAILWWCGHEHAVASVAPLKIPSSKVLAVIEDAAHRDTLFPTLLAEPLSNLPADDSSASSDERASSDDDTGSEGGENDVDNLI